MTDTMDPPAPGPDVHIPLDGESEEVPLPPEVIDADERFEERRLDARQLVRRRRLRKASVVVGVLCAIALAYGAFSLPVLSLQTFDIGGGEHLGPAEIEAALGVEVGARLLSLDTSALERRLEELPWVRRADVMVRWPNTLRVRVLERDAIGVVTSTGSQPMAVASGGMVAGAAGAGEKTLVVAAVPGSVRRGVRLTTPVADAVRTVGALPASLAAEMAGATIDGSGSIELKMRRGIVVVVGPPEQVRAKFDALDAMIGSGIDLRGIRRIDVSVPSAVTMSS